MLFDEEPGFPSLSAAWTYLQTWFEPESPESKDTPAEGVIPWFAGESNFYNILIFLKESLTVGSASWPHTQSAGDMIIERLRTVAQALVWAQKNDSKIPTIFLEHGGLQVLVGAVVAFQTPHSIRIQAWQTLCMVIQNVKQDFFDQMIASGNINALFDGNPEGEDGCFEYYLSLIKALSQRLHSANAIYMVSNEDFPLLRKAIALTTHRDSMVRTSARTTYLTLLRIQESAVQKVCVAMVKGTLLRPLGALLRSQWAALVEAARQENPSAFRQAAYDEEETFAHLAELLLLGEPEVAEAVAQLLGRELLQGQLPQLRETFVASDVFETQTDIVPSPGMSPISSPKPWASPQVNREASDVVMTEQFSALSSPQPITWESDNSMVETETSPYDRAVAARAIAAFARAMGDADLMGVVMPVLELSLRPTAPASLVRALSCNRADVQPKDLAAFVEQLAASAMEDTALKRSGDCQDRTRYWEDQLRLAPGLRSGAGLIANPFRSSILSMLEGSLELLFLGSAPNEIFLLKSVTDPNVAARLAITEMKMIYPKLLVHAGLARPVQPAPIVEEMPAKKTEDAGNFLSGLSWLFNASRVSGQWF